MVDDVFVEQFVKREKTSLNTAFTVFSITITVAIIVAINVIPMLLGINIIFITGRGLLRNIKI